MPYFTTKSRQHYHATYDCCGARMLCGTAGLEPCSKCVGRQHSEDGSAPATSPSSLERRPQDVEAQTGSSSLTSELYALMDAVNDSQTADYLRNTVFAIDGQPLTQDELEEVLLHAVMLAETGAASVAQGMRLPEAPSTDRIQRALSENIAWFHTSSHRRSSRGAMPRVSVVDEETLLPQPFHLDEESLRHSQNPDIIRYIAGRTVIGYPLFTKEMKKRNKREKGYIGAEIERRCGGQNDDLPHADLVSEHGTYEIKSNTDPNGNMTMFDKVPSNLYVQGECREGISAAVMRNRRICALFGGPSSRHPGMMSYAAPNAPAYYEQTSYAGQTIKVDEQGVYIAYEYSKDQRIPCPVPAELRHDEVEIFRWSRQELEQHISDKFGQDGTLSFHPSAKGSPYCDCMDVLRPFDYDEFIEYLKRGLIKFDAGLCTDVLSASTKASGEGRMHFMWRFTPAGCNELCIESWIRGKDGTFRQKRSRTQLHN